MKQFLLISINRLDYAIWLLVLLFFSGSAFLFNGNVPMAILGASGIIIEMLFIGLAVEVIIECLKKKEGIGTITGFITNGPEAICLIVGLVVGDIIFAASTPLGSNFINPILLVIAGIICRKLWETITIRPLYTIISIFLTIAFAGTFFLLDEKYYLYWLIGVILVTLPLFYFRPKEIGDAQNDDFSFNPTFWLLPAIILLTTAGYYLDPVVSFAAQHSHTPKGIIGFLVLATLTSWPEFKSCLALLARNKPLAAVLNIVVSNITNLWLAALGVATYFSR